MNKNKKDKKIVIYSANGKNIDNNFIKNIKKNYNEDTTLIITEGKTEAEYLKKIFTNNLVHYMEQKGINATKLSKDLDIKYSTVRDWCNAKNYPRVDKIQLLANYFNINKSDLTEDKPKNKIPVLGNIPARYPYWGYWGD